jgi:hypothetical protein
MWMFRECAQIYIGVHGTRVAAVPEPLFEAKDVALRIVDALQKTLKAMQTDESQLQAPSTAELKTNFEATNGGGEGPINVKISVRGLEVLILGISSLCRSPTPILPAILSIASLTYLPRRTEDYSKSVTRGFVARSNAEFNYMSIYPELVPSQEEI